MNSLQPSAFNLAPSPTLQWQPVRSANFLAIAGRSYPVNTTSAAITVTLPLNPNPGDQITLTDYAGTFGTNALTINPNGGKINGSASNYVVSQNRWSFQLVYVDSTQGWLIYGTTNLTVAVATPSINYLVVAGGGGGGYQQGGGGGAGGMKTGSMSVVAGVSYSITVGNAGAGATSGVAATAGGSSTFVGSSTITTTGGGIGASLNAFAPTTGGSGGGGASTINSGNGAAGTSGEGNAGGNAFSGGAGGGGGGKGGAGSNAPSSLSGGNGGAGAEWPTSSGSYYAGGGGGGAFTPGGTPGTGGTGGGGNGGGNGVGGSGQTNTGGGGGGGGQFNATIYGGGNGGSGVVTIRYEDTYAAATSTTGSPTVTVSGGYRTYKFTGNGSITF